MALQSSGPISLNDVAGEFSGSTPHSLSEYYGVDDGVPGSGTISLSNFYGKSAAVDPGPDPDPDPIAPPYRTTGWGGTPGRIDYSSQPGFGGTSYISAYGLTQTSGVSGGVQSIGLFTEGVGTLGGAPGLSANGFSRVYMSPQTSGATWGPGEYTTISIGAGGDGLEFAGWYVYNPVWSRYQPPGSSGFSNVYYLSSASGTAPIIGPAANGDTVGTIGAYIAQAMDAGNAGVGVDFISGPAV